MRGLSSEELLERCLEKVTWEDVEVMLQHHPQQAEELRPLLELAAAARHYYDSVPEPPGGLNAGRARMLTAAAQGRAEAQGPVGSSRKERSKMRLAFATKLVSTVLAVVMGTTAVGSGVAWAASDTLPGDALYPVKLAVEDVRLGLTRTVQSRVDLALRLVEERAAEVRGLVQAGLPIPDEVAVRMETHVRYALQWIASAPEEDMPGLLERVSMRTQTQAQVLARVRAMAPEQTQAGVRRAEQVCIRAHEEAVAGLTNPHAFRWRYQRREGMPDEVDPPKPPTLVPPQGPDGSDHSPGETPQGDQERHREQEQHQERNQEGDQQGDQERYREENQEQRREQEQHQNQEHDQQGDQQGSPGSTPQGAHHDAGWTPGPGSNPGGGKGP